MSDKDQFDEQAEQLLPCQYVTRLCNPEFEELCYGCQHRPAVAAALREAVEEQKKLGQIAYEADGKVIADLRTENEQLKTDLDVMGIDGIVMRLIAERDDLKAKLAKLDERLSCGHRKVDWDDSYGDCAFCIIKSQADDYERLPLTLVEAHDQIDELKAKLAASNRCIHDLLELSSTPEHAQDDIWFERFRKIQDEWGNMVVL